MSIVADYMPKCDKCKKVDAGLASFTAREAREEARRNGWKRVGKEDVCPECWNALISSKPETPPF